MIATTRGGVFGLVLTQRTTGNVTIRPGAIAIKTAKEIQIIEASPTDPIYFSALMLWAHFAGDSYIKFANDERLPDYVRVTLRGFGSLEAAIRMARRQRTRPGHVRQALSDGCI